MNFLLGEPAGERGPVSPRDGKGAGEDGGGSDRTGAGRPGKKRDTPSFDISRAMAHIFALSEQIGERPAGSVRESGAADYIVQKLGEYGYTVEDQPFTTAEGYSSRNVFATSEGGREGFVMTVAAHYDSARGRKGAVDNGSGAGVVLELARVLKDAGLGPTIQFVFFGANMPGAGGLEERLVGSRRYVDMLGSMERRETIGMISVDAVSAGEVLALRTQGTGLQRLRAKMETFARKRDIPVAALKAADDSDNIPFEDNGIPAVWIEWCDAAVNLITDDVYNSVIPGKVETAGRFIEGFLYDLTSEDLEELKY